MPVKAICLASGLFFVGTILLVFGSLLFSGYFNVKVGTRSSITFTSITRMYPVKNGLIVVN